MHLHPTLVAATFLVTPGLALAAGADAFDRSMQPALQSYLKIHDALAGDKMEGVQAEAGAIAAQAGKLDAKGVTGGHAEHYRSLPTSLRQAAEKLSEAKSIDAAREAFKDLSKPMAMWATHAKPMDVVVVFCSMAKGSWLQKKGEIQNPYYGASMLGCGQIMGGGDDAVHHEGMHHGEMTHGGH